ncbi:YncE family protein [Paraliomyxa miuraensis]|uniref:YncE family protein n=1 Tax=Paraliomyxa miuraensis TaxID=376150 RepID=UPI002256428C|nr:hypothetical protein [Paraliomyxa miuraensis]MCX4244428.1 hypothetical protein [Paraliomyxa miuraensis]
MRAPLGTAAALVPLLTLAMPGCRESGSSANNLGVPPPEGILFFPSGLLLDPVVRDPAAEGEQPAARYLFVANGNNDRTYNAGTVVAIDLREFWDAWYDPAIGGLDPYCGPERCVLPPGSVIDENVDEDELPLDRPCRRLQLAPHVVECDERSFVAASARVGDFATTLSHSIEADGSLRLWLPVRGDPSITFIDVDPDGDGIEMKCDQGGDLVDPKKCGPAHRLDQLRNDDTLDPLDREPFNVVVWSETTADPVADPPERLGFVAHAAGAEMSLIDLDGVPGDSTPALVDFASLYQTPGGGTGGFGLAVRPCFAAGQGPLGAADPVDNVPVLTEGCTRPLVYTSFRYVGRVASVTASGLEVTGEYDDVVAPADREDCMVQVGGREVYAGPYCAEPSQLDQPCAVSCEPRIRSPRQFFPSLIIGDSASSGPVLGHIAFADPRGDQLLVLQTNPGGLLSLDTSIGPDGEPLDIPSAPPVEICAEPSVMRLYTETDGSGLPAQRYALISCFRAALVYIVDIEALRVVDSVVVGTGPHDIAIDQAREVAYVINNLESSVSVIDLSRTRGTRFQELARLGLQDPFSQ